MANYTFDTRPLAQGGEKDIHRGRCVETGMDVVVKFLRRPYSEAEKRRFALEIERMLKAKPSAGAALTTIFDHNLDHDPPFFIEEFVPDGTLAMKMAGVFAKRQVFSEGAALGYCRQALALLQGLGDRHGQAQSWDSVGLAHHCLGNHQEAVHAYRTALDLFRELDDRVNAAATLDRLGDTYQVTGRTAHAAVAWRRSLAIFEELGRADADLVRAKLHGERTASRGMPLPAPER